MAFVTREEFAALCLTTVAIVNTNVSRKKIHVENKLIDTEHPLNKIFKKKYRNLATEKKKTQVTEKKSTKDVPQTSPIAALYNEVVEKFKEDLEPKSSTNERSQDEDSSDDLENMSWDARKKRADALKAEKQAELAQLNVEKLMGKLMPVELVEQVLRVNIQDIFKTMENDLINIASIYCDVLAGGDREKLSEVVKRMRISLNKIIKNVEETSLQEIENIVGEYAETRNRGERK